MQLNLIRELSANYNGGLRKLASDIGMSESNIHRCINKNAIEAGQLERIAQQLRVPVTLFFGQQSDAPTTINSHRLKQMIDQLQTTINEQQSIISKIQNVIPL